MTPPDPQAEADAPSGKGPSKWRRWTRFGRTLAFRLVFWYAGIVTLSVAAVFLFFYLYLGNLIRERIDQDLLAEMGTFSTLMTTSGVEAVQRLAQAETQAAGERQFFFRLLYSSGVAFSSSNMAYWRNIGVDRKAVERLLTGTEHLFADIEAPERGGRIRLLYGLLGPGIVLQLGKSMEIQTRFAEAFGRVFSVTALFLLAGSVIAGVFMARKALSGVAEVTRTARRISEGRLDSRVAIRQRGDEIEQLADTFNRMLDRIETLVDGIREMNDNIAHDLKSPVARIRGIAELSLTTPATPVEWAEATASIVEECDRLLDMINTMLLISRTEAGVGEIQGEAVDLAALLRDACALFEATAEDHGLILACRAAKPCPISGDRRMLQRMVANLIDNALRYTPAGGRVQAEVHCDGHEARIAVSDSGIGIPEKDLPHIFDRFFRCDPSRTDTGAGLGLSLAQAVCQAHRGRIAVQSAPGRGSTFTVTLPQAPEPDQSPGRPSG